MYRVVALKSQVRGSAWQLNYSTLLLTSLAALAVLLALLGVSLGLFGVIATAVDRNRRELALRLGSTPHELISRVFGEALPAVCGGAAVGLLLAWGLSGFVRASLFGTSPHHVGVMATVVFIILVVSGLACLIPALSAARTQPAMVLRE